jgi:FAD/FMN-containing dehydrogenase
VPGKYEKDKELLEKFKALVLEEVLKRGGSISAEHGLGQYKHKYVPHIKDPATLATMKVIKKRFDTYGILHPEKYLNNYEKLNRLSNIF